MGQTYSGGEISSVNSFSWRSSRQSKGDWGIYPQALINNGFKVCTTFCLESSNVFIFAEIGANFIGESFVGCGCSAKVVRNAREKGRGCFRPGNAAMEIS